MKYTPHKYQEKAIRFMIERACAGLFMEPGLGKTSTTLAAYVLLKEQKLVDSMLVMAPLRVCYSVWAKEPQKWDEFKHLSIGILHGPDKDEVLRQKHDLYVINPEGLKWLVETLPKKNFPFHVFCCDESSMVKHTNTQRFKLLKQLLNKFRRRYILTGTPAPNGLMDLFGQAYVMDMGATFGPYITHFRKKYFNQSGYMGYDWTPKHESPRLIEEALSPRVLTMKTEDYLTLPPLIESDIVVDLPLRARRIYDQMESALRLDFAAGRVTAATAAVASMKCRQIASGGVYGEQGETHQIHDAKTEALVDLLDELNGQPALVAYEFHHDLERIKAKLGDDVPHIGGGVSARESADIISRWDRGEVPVLLAQAASIAHGVNLQKTGRAVVWYSPTWNLEHHDQLIRRIWRQGQTERVFVYNILARDTIDQVIVAALKSKDKTQQGLMTALKNYWN